MSTQISLFNHKGGVSKTTTAFNLGWMLASKGKRILLVDCDPQCNLTGMFLGFTGMDEFDSIYNQAGIRNIRDGLAPAFESKPVPLEPVICETMKGQSNLFLLPGHIGLAEYETTLGIAQELSGSLVTLQNLPGSLHYLFDITATKYNIDIVIVDMSPSLGPINQNLLATSDFFIVPMAPDYFSVMATESLSKVLPKWKEWANTAKYNKVLQAATYPLPQCNPRFLGTILQRYRVREGNTPSTAFQRWIEKVENKVETVLLPVLKENSMLLPETAYTAAKMGIGGTIAQLGEFNGLIAQSQKHKQPVFNLTDEQLEQTGIVLERTKKSMRKFNTLFSDAATKVLTLVDNA
ncbi:ParA family protein [Methylocella sp.]|uniref:ParA family protein n=1 Tax=Methylocella sp. TaxID=1978226 RepID=UPI003783C474